MTAASGRPNIVFILADDMGWADVGCYGSTFYETPHIDELARQGVRWTDAYCAAPNCSPTRASLLSGKYPASVGVTQWIGGSYTGAVTDVPYLAGLAHSEYTMARALRDAGYRTWHLGKWHLGSREYYPDRHGFDANLGGFEAGQPPRYFSPYRIPTLPDGPVGEYLTDRLSDEAVGVIEASGEEPFFINLWHYAPHQPIQAPAALVQKYRDKAERLGLDVDPLVTGEPLPEWESGSDRVRRRPYQSNPTFAAMLEVMDAGIGRILDALRRTGKENNTIVVFTTDNGGLSSAAGSPTSNAPLREGKGWLYEGGIRVPLVMRWPDGGVTGGRVVDEPTTSPDFYPTFLEAAEIAPAPRQPLDGKSMLARARGDREWARGPIFWHFPHYSAAGNQPGAAVRRGDLKLVVNFQTGIDELYDVRADPSERTDLAGRAEYRDASRDLRSLLEVWQEEAGALFPRPNPDSKFADL